MKKMIKNIGNFGMNIRSSFFPKSSKKFGEVKGVKIAVGKANIYYKDRYDLILVQLSKGTRAAGLFTTSATCSPTVRWNRKIIDKGIARGLVVNSGNANTFTGKQGEVAIENITKYASKLLKCKQSEILICSTGVIGEKFPDRKVIKGLENIYLKSESTNWLVAAKAIMTTDTVPKITTRTAQIGKTKVKITGIAKGSGMVAPNMATMLAFIFTDAKIQNHLLKSLLFVENRESFNSITIDGDTSTNDSVIFFSTGKANKHSSIIRVSDKLLSDFRLKFQEVMTDLATQIVSDGEGASKLIFIKVIGAVTKKSAKSVGLEIANSPLVKTAFAGEDPNWGRIVMAIGKSNEPVNINKLKIKIGDQLVTKRGSLNPAYEEEKAKKYLKNKKIKILIDLGVGSRESTITTCDLTKKYIDINTDYRS